MDCKPYLRAHCGRTHRKPRRAHPHPERRGYARGRCSVRREVARCLWETLALCERLGFRTGNMDHRIGWCEYGEGEEMIAVLGHLDVVPAGDGWSEAEPFSGEVKNGRIYGPRSNG